MQIFDEKYRRRSGISLSEYMDLPQPRNEHRKVMDDFIHGKIAIGKIFFFGKIVNQSWSQLRSAAINHCLPIKHPFLFRNIIIPDTPCMRIDTGKQLSVDGNIFIRSKTESLLRQKFCLRDITSPRNLCNDPLHYFKVRPTLSKFPHIFNISRRKSRHFRESIF